MATTVQATRAASKETRAAASDEHGFDTAGFGRRVNEELARRGVPLLRDENIYLAQLFASRARGRGVVENMFAHPLWVHIAARHDDKRQSRVEECKDCALLWSQWLVYLYDRDSRRKRREALSKASRQTIRAFAELAPLLAASSREARAYELLRELEGMLRGHAVKDQGEPATGRTSSPQGRRSLTLLRDIEHALRAAGFTDRQVSEFQFGYATSSTLRGIRDRRRSKTE